MWKLLVLLHALSAIVLIGASTHHAVIAIRMLRGVFAVRLARLYALVGAVAYAVTFVLGAVAYPRFRHLVRAAYLDEYASWASRLFEAKEDLAALALPLVIGALIVARFVDSKSDRHVLVTYAFTVTTIATIVWFNVVSGLLITMTKAG